MKNVLNTQTLVKQLERASMDVLCANFAGNTINTKDQLNMAVQKTISSICEKPVVNKIAVDINVDLNGEGMTKVVRTIGTNSPMACQFDYINKEMTVELEGYSLVTGSTTGYYATTDFIYISCKDCKTDHQEALLQRIINYGIYKQGKKILFPEYKDGVLVSLRIGSPYGKKVEGDINAIINNHRVAFYAFFNASPSQERNADLVGIDARKYNAKARFELLDRIMGGAIMSTIGHVLTPQDKLDIAEGRKALTDFPEFRDNFTKKEASKLPTRVAQQNTASMELASIGNDKYGVLYINEAFFGGSDYNDAVNKALSEDYGVEIDNMITDGQAIATEQIFIDAAADRGVTIKRSAVRGSAFQMRTEGLNDKVFTLFVSKMMITRIAKTLINKFKDVKDSNGNPVIYVIGNENNIAYIVDGNAAKLPNFWRMNREDAILRNMEYGNFKMAILAPANDSEANTSIQALGKVLCDKLLSALTDNFYNMLGSSLERILKGSLSVGSKTARTQKFFAANLGRSTETAATQEMAMKELADQGMSALRKLKIPVSGSNLRALFDNTHLVTGNDNLSVLKLNDKGHIQAYSKTVCNKFRKELALIKADYDETMINLMASKEAGDMDEQSFNISRIVAKAVRTSQVDWIMTSYTVKYPCPTDIEFAMFRYLAWFEVEEAIEALPCNEYDKSLLVELYGSLKTGIVMIAPLNTIKHALAGMDTDYDGVTSFFEYEMVNQAVSNYERIAVYIDKAEGEKSKSMFKPGAKQQSQVTVNTVDTDCDEF